jgi:Zn-dependent protease
VSDERQSGGWLPPAAPATEPPVPDRTDEPSRGGRSGGGSVLSRLAAPFIALVALAGKLKGVLLLLPKAKFLVTSGSMLVSVAAYASIWGWRFAAGFVVLLFVHEMGHVIQLRREGVHDASAPVFIPFLGALVWARSLGGDAAAEARVGLAGPVLGTIGAALCLPIHAATGDDFWLALGFTGFFLNLFNLLPFGFLDGARAAAAMSPWMWLLGVFGMVVLVLTFPNPIIVLIAVLGAFETYRRFRGVRSGDPEVTKYYKVAPRDRIIVTAVYLGLIAALVLGMDATHLERTL